MAMPITKMVIKINVIGLNVQPTNDVWSTVSACARARERERERERETHRGCLLRCVCVRARAREREIKSECVGIVCAGSGAARCV